MKLYTKKLFFALSFCFTALAFQAQITWTNGNATNLFSDPANWSTATVPTSADDVIFDGTSSANCTIDLDIQINNLTITAAYTGIIDGTTLQNRLIQTNNFSQAGGTFISTDDTYNVTGNMTLTGGTFNSNGGNVTLFINSGATIVISGAFAFNDLTVTHPTPVTGVSQRNLNFGSSSSAISLNLSGTNRLYSYQGSITVTSALNVLGTHVGNPTGNTGIFILGGAGPITVSGTTGAGRNKLGNVTINTAGVLTINSQISVQGTWTNSNIGSLAAGTSTVHFGGSATAAIASGTTAAAQAYFSNLNVLGTSTLSINNGSFVDLTGNFSQAGAFTPNKSLVQFTGSSAHAVNGAATLTAFNAIEKSGAGALTFAHTTNVLDSLKITAGAVTGTNLVFKSTSALKGRLAEITSGSISGNITVETFIPGGATDWAVLGGSGVSGLTFNSWYGQIPMAIEGSTTGVTSAGGQYFESVWRWDETDAFGYDSTVVVTDPINVGQGYWLYVGNSTVSTGNIITTVAGPPVTGPQPLTISNTPLAQAGSCLLANPFASPISWDRIFTDDGFSTTGQIWVYNADLGTTTDYVGGVSSHTNGITSTIPMGQGFYVVANPGFPTITIDESHKVSNNTGANPLLKTTAASVGSVIRLQVNGGGFSDQTAIHFNSAATANFDKGLDGMKHYDTPGYAGYGKNPWTIRTTISTMSGSGDYAINSLPYPVTTNAVIPVRVKVYATGQHTISATDLNNLPSGTCVTLKDKLLNVTHNLATGPYVCSINDTTSAARFELTICANIVMGVNNISIGAESMLVNQDANGVYVDLKFENTTKAYITANNILGQQLMPTKQVECVSGRYYLDLNAKEQIIMVNVITNEKRTTKKIFVQQN